MMVRTPQYWREHYQLDTMAINARVDVNAGFVVRVRPHEYVLHPGTPLSRRGPRSRWGTSAEIAEDIAYMEAYGAMPPANGGPW